MKKTGEYIFLLGDLDYEVVRGHVDEATAREVVSAERGWPEPEDAVTVTHAYARWTPAERGKDWDAEFRLSKKGPGAFPVTLVASAKRAIPQAALR